MPDLILLGTIVPVKPSGARAEALAIADGRITAIDGNAEVLARRTAPETPVRAHGFSPAGVAESRPPTRAELDRVAPDRVVDRGHHACYANTAAPRALAERDPALAGAGITHLHALDGGWSGPDDPALILDEARRPGPRITLYEQVTGVEHFSYGTRDLYARAAASFAGELVWGSLDEPPAATR